MTIFETAQAQMTTFRTRRPGKDLRPDPADLETLQESTDYVTALLETLTQRERAVSVNTRLSDLGKQEKFREVAQGALGETGPIRRKIETTKEALDRLKGLVLDYMALPAGSDRLEVLLVAQEVRQQFRHQPQHEKERIFFEAAQKLDRTTMRAFITAPGGAWISSEFLERAEAAYGERNNPEAWQQIRRLTLMLDHLTGLCRLITIALLQYQVEPAAIEKALGVTLQELNIEPPKKPLPQLAGGKADDRG